ncbi:MAG: hypothetical protein ACT4QC_00850 [Planctomycetaceae bacterium]
MPSDVVRARVLQWAAERLGADSGRLEAIGRQWEPGERRLTPEELFDLAIRSFAQADPATRTFVEACALVRPPLLAPEAKMLAESGQSPFYRANLALFYGRYLTHRRMFDEALSVLDDIDLEAVIDPAGLLFYKAVCQHRLLRKAEGLATIGQLLKNTEGVPVRYSTVATLMQHDLEALDEESLDEISRKMAEVERRLSLGRAGQKVQKQEDEIVASLDAIIKKIEEQQNSGGGGGAGGAANRSSGPAGDSGVKGSTAPGHVDPKKITPGGEWGNLPPRVRARAKELIAREFPAHYRTAIEEFTRKGANRAAASGK